MTKPRNPSAEMPKTAIANFIELVEVGFTVGGAASCTTRRSFSVTCSVVLFLSMRAARLMTACDACCRRASSGATSCETRTNSRRF